MESLISLDSSTSNGAIRVYDGRAAFTGAPQTASDIPKEVRRRSRNCTNFAAFIAGGIPSLIVLSRFCKGVFYWREHLCFTRCLK
jgi:hypothetical protein